MNHPTLPDYRLIEQLDFVDFYSNPSGDTLIARFKESSVVDLGMAKESLEFIRRHKQNKRTYGITDARAKFLDFKGEARNYYRENMLRSETILHAIVVSDFPTKLSANLYARFEKPNIPTRVFTSLEDAINWIEEARI
jgi:hypothetical protein